jgi:hypothetical protein
LARRTIHAVCLCAIPFAVYATLASK